MTEELPVEVETLPDALWPAVNIVLQYSQTFQNDIECHLRDTELTQQQRSAHHASYQLEAVKTILN